MRLSLYIADSKKKHKILKGVRERVEIGEGERYKNQLHTFFSPYPFFFSISLLLSASFAVLLQRGEQKPPSQFSMLWLIFGCKFCKNWTEINFYRITGKDLC